MTPRKSWDQILGEGSIIEHDGQTYEIGPLKNSDIAELITETKKRNTRLLFQAAPGVAPPHITSSAAAHIAGGTFSDADVIAEATGLVGASWIVERALVRGGNPKPKAAKLIELLDHAMLMDKAAVVLELSGLITIRRDGNTQEGQPSPPVLAPTGDTSPAGSQDIMDTASEKSES